MLLKKFQGTFIIFQILADLRHSNVKRLLADAGVGVLVQKRAGFFQQFQGTAQFGVIPFVQPKCLVQHSAAVDDIERIGVLFQRLFGFVQAAQVFALLAVQQTLGGGVNAVIF